MTLDVDHIKSVIGNVAVVAGVALFALTMLDIFLSDTQKGWLNNKLFRLWFWLSEAKGHSLLGWLRLHHRSLNWIAIFLAIAYTAWAFRRAVFPSPSMFAITIGVMTFAIGLRFGLKIIRLTLHASSLFWAALRVTVFVFVTLVPVAIFLLIVYVFKDQFRSLATSFGISIATGQRDLAAALFALSYLWAYVLFIHCTVLALIFWATVAVPLLLIYALSDLLLFSEFIARRLVEYPKGPILAISAVLTALGALFKVLS